MAYEVFGIGDHNPAMRPRDFTLEELERYARWTDDYQRRLKLDPCASFGPPEGEVWPPDPEVVFETRIFPRPDARAEGCDRIGTCRADQRPSDQDVLT